MRLTVFFFVFRRYLILLKYLYITLYLLSIIIFYFFLKHQNFQFLQVDVHRLKSLFYHLPHHIYIWFIIIFLQHKGLQFHGIIAVGHRGGLLASHYQRQRGIDGDIAQRGGDGFVDRVRQMVPTCRGCKTAVDRQRHSKEGDVVARIRGPLLEAATWHSHAGLCTDREWYKCNGER